MPSNCLSMSSSVSSCGCEQLPYLGSGLFSQNLHHVFEITSKCSLYQLEAQLMRYCAVVTTIAALCDNILLQCQAHQLLSFPNDSASSLLICRHLLHLSH